MTSLDRNPFHRSSPPMPLSARAVPRRFSPRLTSGAPSVSESQVPLIQSWTDRIKKSAWDRVTGWVRRRVDEWVHRSIDQLLPEPSLSLHNPMSSVLSLPPPVPEDPRNHRKRQKQTFQSPPPPIPPPLSTSNPSESREAGVCVESSTATPVWSSSVAHVSFVEPPIVKSPLSVRRTRVRRRPSVPA